jgi:hypothetical protein
VIEAVRQRAEQNRTYESKQAKHQYLFGGMVICAGCRFVRARPLLFSRVVIHNLLLPPAPRGWLGRRAGPALLEPLHRLRRDPPLRFGAQVGGDVNAN